jgi:hypothetical protein
MQLILLCFIDTCCALPQGQRTTSFELKRGGLTSAGLYSSSPNGQRAGQLIRSLFSGRHYKAGPHNLEVELPADGGDDDDGYELRVVSSGATKYEWEGVIGNTGPLNGPGALKGSVC